MTFPAESISYGEKTRPGQCPAQQLIAPAPVDDKSGAGGPLSGEIPGILNICAHREPIARCPVDFLCRFPLVIFQQAAQSFPALHCSLFPSCLPLKRKQYAILLALMVPLFMVMQQILMQGSPQRGLSNQDGSGEDRKST